MIKIGKELRCLRHHSKGDRAGEIGGILKYISSSIRVPLFSELRGPPVEEVDARQKLSKNDNTAHAPLHCD